MEPLAKKKCIPCERGAEPLPRGRVVALLPQVPDWNLSEDGKSIKREYEFRDFIKAIGFVDKVADVAEFEGHHPDIHIWYNNVKLELSTHSIGGLSENDFILAAKIDAII